MSVLIVDDAAFMRRFIASILERHDIQVAGEADNGLEAVRQYKALSPALVTMDISMPELGGIEAIKAILEIDPGAKIIVCSVMGYEGTILDAVKAGAKGYIVKPINVDRMIQEVKKHLPQEEASASLP